jgi:hypothetical protein
VLASRVLHPVRLRHAAALAQRRARRGDWLVMSAAELGVLAHLPADPARWQFTTAALERPHPHAAYLASPEPATAASPGWARGQWSSTPAHAGPQPGPAQPDLGGDDHDRC